MASRNTAKETLISIASLCELLGSLHVDVTNLPAIPPGGSQNGYVALS